MTAEMTVSAWKTWCSDCRQGRVFTVKEFAKRWVENHNREFHLGGKAK